MPLASTVMDEAAGLLNDVNKTLFTYTVQLPYLSSAWNKLQLKLQENSIPVMREVSTTINVNANASTVTLSSDVLQPIKLEERERSSSDLWTEVEEVESIPVMDQVDSILYWCWREETLEINSPRTDREVRLTYWKSLNPCTSSSSNLNVTKSLEYLANKTAALCARYIGENETRASSLEFEASQALQTLLNLEIKNRQNLPVRPKSYGSRSTSV